MEKEITKSEIDGKEQGQNLSMPSQLYRIFEMVRIEDPELDEATAFRIANNVPSKILSKRTDKNIKF